MGNNRIRDAIIDHFMMKKEQSAIPSLFGTMQPSCETFHTISKAYLKYNPKIIMVVMGTKLEQNKLN